MTTKSLNRPDRMLMQLLACGLEAGELTRETFAATDEATWEEVLAQAIRQGVSAIAYDALQDVPTEGRPPRKTLFRWAANTDRIERDFVHKQEVLARLAAFYKAHGIEMMVLKGYGLALRYPTPAHRPSGDIDIWLYGRQQEADALVRQELHIPVRDDVHHHTVFVFQGVTVENHFDFLNLWAHRSNRELERHLRCYAEHAGAQVVVGTTAIDLPSADLNALFLMRHMAIHFATAEIGLRHLADWAVFLRTEGQKVDWETIRGIYRAQNMHRFADAVTALCVEWLGVERSVCPYEEDPALRDLVLQDMLHPAFGEKSPARGIASSIRYKVRRWWAHRWKHRLVYKDTLTGSFLWLCWAHVIRPKTIVR